MKVQAVTSLLLSEVLSGRTDVRLAVCARVSQA
jgi:hypothetical protein